MEIYLKHYSNRKKTFYNVCVTSKTTVIVSLQILDWWLPGSCPAWCQDSYRRRALTDRVSMSVCVSFESKTVRE